MRKVVVPTVSLIYSCTVSIVLLLIYWLICQVNLFSDPQAFKPLWMLVHQCSPELPDRPAWDLRTIWQTETLLDFSRESPPSKTFQCSQGTAGCCSSGVCWTKPLLLPFTLRPMAGWGGSTTAAWGDMATPELRGSSEDGCGTNFLS